MHRFRGVNPLLTMKFIAILSAFIVGCVVQATPLSVASGTGTTVFTKTTFSTSKEEALNAAIQHSGLHNLADPSALHVTATSPVPPSSLEKRQTLPVLVFCSGINCSGTCDAFTIIGIPEKTCFAPFPDPFFSLFISNPSEFELFFFVRNWRRCQHHMQWIGHHSGN